MNRSEIMIAGCRIELHEAGSGAPLIYLHPGGGFRSGDAFNALLSSRRRLICPSHPGFGTSDLPGWIDAVDDIAHIYLELLDRLGIAKADFIGCSIGGWILAEMATKAPERFGKIVMVGAVGVKTGPVDRLDIPDIFVMAPAEVPKLMFHDPAKMAFNPAAMNDEELRIHLRNRESLALLVWEPYMHNPKLPHRLHRVASPALFLRGESDGLVSEAYMQAYAGLLPHAQTATIAAAGHAPQLEQPDVFAKAVLDFLN